MKVILIEDNAVPRDAVQSHILRASHAVDWFQTAQDADMVFSTTDYDLARLDLGLPDAWIS